MKRYKTVQAYLDSLDQWAEEVNRLREIVLSTGIEETVKWGKSCRREYAEYISGAKRKDTKRRRLEKIMPMIVKSVGMNDKYRK